MKKNTEQYKNLSKDELLKKAEALRLEIVNTKRGVKLGDVINTQITKKNRRDLARALTLISKADTTDSNEKPAKKENK